MKEMMLPIFSFLLMEQLALSFQIPKTQPTLKYKKASTLVLSIYLGQFYSLNTMLAIGSVIKISC